jgi:uncharacterized protein
VSLPGLLLVFAAALAAGAVNSIAGGGTLLTFPALVWLGLPPISANATSTIALWPGSFGSMWAYRRQLTGASRWLLWFTVPSVAGGIAGAQLLLHTSADRFDAIVPFLVLAATVLFLLQPPLSRRLARRLTEEHAVNAELPAPSLWILAAQLGVAVYGGYFGAGIGILMLATLGAIGLSDIHRMNGIKNWAAMWINATAAITFAFSDIVIWPVALTMAVGGLAGGYGGARLALRVGQKWVRRAVVAIGFLAFLWLMFSR